MSVRHWQSRSIRERFVTLLAIVWLQTVEDRDDRCKDCAGAAAAG